MQGALFRLAPKEGGGGGGRRFREVRLVKGQFPPFVDFVCACLSLSLSLSLSLARSLSASARHAQCTKLFCTGTMHIGHGVILCAYINLPTGFRSNKGKLHSKIISSDMKDFFRRIQWCRSEVEIRTERRSNRRSKMAEKSRVTTTPRGRHESWCQASAVRGCHNDSLWHPLHTKEGDEISMFWGPCLQSSISRLSFSFLALFFCYAVSSCVYDHNHPYLVSERLFLAENEAFPYLRRALAHLRRALAILWDAAATWAVVIFVVVTAKQRSPKMSVACVQGPVDRSPYRSPPVTLNGHCGVIF